MRFFISLFLFVVTTALSAAAGPSTWPPVWASDTNGGLQGVAQDDHTGFDYGTDKWGYWANLDIEDGSGNPLATMEMRYIVPANYTRGAYPGEEGVRIYEMPRVNVPATDINGNQPFWVSSLECTQQVWEEVQKISLPTFNMKLAQWNKSDIADTATASFPIDLSTFVGSVDLSGYPIALTEVGAWFGAVSGLFDAAFDLNKEFRAIESQTFVESKDFCENKLESQVRAQSGSGTLNIRLPTEVEWEFFCRAGTSSAFWCGPILGGVNFKMENLTVAKTKFLFPFDSAIIDANIFDALGGDGDLHREWFSEGKTHITLSKVTLDGTGTSDMTVKKDIAGKVSLSGDLTVMEVVANFDERYQTHYKPNEFGSVTPVLMSYVLQGVDYIPKPYEPIGANVYYRYLGTDVYVLASTVTLANSEINRTYSVNPDNMQPADTVPGDYTALGRLEYVEMVMVNSRCDAGGTETENGKYVYDSLGNIQPIRTLYTPAAYDRSGKFIGSTFPDLERGSQSNESFARKSDLSDNAAEEMTIDDYILKFKQACEDHLNFKVQNANPWYSGQKNYVVTYTETEFDVNGNPVEVNKSKTVTVDKIIPSTYHAEYLENITVNSTINSAITAITPDKQKRNPFGLYNTHGNVAEWVDTTWDGKSDLSAPAVGSKQITRGGSWRNGAQYCRSASRVGRDPNMAYDDVGFRFILTD